MVIVRCIMVNVFFAMGVKMGSLHLPRIKIEARNIMPKIVWVSLILALVASLSHVAWSFGALEFTKENWQGWTAAIAVDIGIVSLTYGIRLRRQARRRSDDGKRHWFADQDGTRGFKFGVMFLVFISIAANTLHGLAVATGGDVTLNAIVKSVQTDPLALVRVFIFAATLPIMVVYLSDIVSGDDERVAKRNEQTDERVQRLTEERSVLVQKIHGYEHEIQGLNAEVNALKTRSVPTEQNGWHEEWTVYLTEHPKATQRDMAEHFGVSVGTVNMRLKKLNGSVQAN